jgi:NADPH-dependent curcumin reductase CurA
MEQERQAVTRNRKVVLRGYIERAPREDDMELVDGGAMELRVPEGAGGPAVLVKNLYLSCDPYMRGRMRDFHGSYIPPFKPGSVSFPRLYFHLLELGCNGTVQIIRAQVQKQSPK